MKCRKNEEHLKLDECEFYTRDRLALIDKIVKENIITEP